LARPVADRIAYVIDSFPSHAASKAGRQILALERQGFVVIPLALHRHGTKAVSETSRWLAERVIYPPPVLSLRCAVSQLVALLRYPSGYLLALRLAVGRIVGYPRQAREILASLVRAGFFAVRMSRRIRHIHAHRAGATATVAWLIAVITGRSYSFTVSRL